MTRAEIAKIKEQIWQMKLRNYIFVKKVVNGYELVNFENLNISYYTIYFMTIYKNEKNNWTLKIVYKYDLTEEVTFYLLKTDNVYEDLKKYEMN